MSHERSMRQYGEGTRGNYYILAYDDIGRLVVRSGVYYRTISQAQNATKQLYMDYGERIQSIKIMKVRPRKNPETVATAVVGTAPATAAPATVTNPCGTRQKKLRYTWGESFHGFYWLDNKTGNTSECGDGVDMFTTLSGKSISAGSPAFYREMNKMMRSSQAEIGEAYFSKYRG